MKDTITQIKNTLFANTWAIMFTASWIVFNYDLLLIIVGNIEYVRDINNYFCTNDLSSTVQRPYILLGCVSPENGYYQFFRTPIIGKFILPLCVTVLYMTVFSFITRWVENVYESIQKKDFLWNIRLKTVNKPLEEQLKKKDEQLKKKNITEDKVRFDCVMNYYGNFGSPLRHSTKFLLIIGTHLHLMQAVYYSAGITEYSVIDNKILQLLEQAIIEEFDKKPEIYPLLQLIGVYEQGEENKHYLSYSIEDNIKEYFKEVIEQHSKENFVTTIEKYKAMVDYNCKDS